MSDKIPNIITVGMLIENLKEFSPDTEIVPMNKDETKQGSITFLTFCVKNKDGKLVDKLGVVWEDYEIEKEENV
jgi:hypothetical protein